MTRKDVSGTCRLCLRPKVLQRSHYIPRSFYKLCRSDGGNPVVATPRIIDRSPKQMWQHLLRSQCEDLLNKRGESYTLDMVFRGDRFSLLERIGLARPFAKSGSVPMFSGTQLGIETEKLGYFALSMVWRGAQGPWKTVLGQTTGVKLGAFEGSIRRYLHAETEWPKDITLVATACTDQASQEGINPPWLIPPGFSGGAFTRIELLVRGIWFWVLMGPVRKEISAWCCVTAPQRPIFMRDYEDEMLSMHRHILESAEDRTSLRHLH